MRRDLSKRQFPNRATMRNIKAWMDIYRLGMITWEDCIEKLTIYTALSRPDIELEMTEIESKFKSK